MNVLTPYYLGLFCRHGERERRDEAPAHLVHEVPDPRAREGVPLQSLPDQAAAHRDRPRALPDRASDKNLVPESPDEVEEGAQDGQHEHRAVSHVAVRPPLPVRPAPRAVRPPGHIGRVLVRRARSSRRPVPRHVRRAELLRETILKERECVRRFSSLSLSL